MTRFTHVRTGLFHSTLDKLGSLGIAAEAAATLSSQPDQAPTPIEAGAAWLRQWKLAVSNGEGEKWQRRLTWAGLDETQAIKALRQAAESAEADTASPLLAMLQAVLRSSAVAAADFDWSQDLPPATGDDSLAFEDLWRPLADGAIAMLRARVSSETLALVSSHALADLRGELLNRLCSLGVKLMWELFEREQAVGPSLLAKLVPGSEESNRTFSRVLYGRLVRRHASDGLDGVLKEFPVFGRLLATVVGFWLENTAEMLSRIAADRSLLAAAYGLNPQAPLTAIGQGLSDPHRGGRVVAILTFGTHLEGAPSWRVVYKPKDMRLDAAYQSALRCLPLDPLHAPLRSLTVVAADGYGYMEFVEHRVCKDDAELARFYLNAGRLTAALHLLGCTDCHSENLIAEGDQLVLIDTETLLEAEVHDHTKDRREAASPAGDSVIKTRFQQSVMRTCLLPRWIFAGSMRVPIDYSALGMDAPAEANHQMLGWLGLNSDAMSPGAVNRPVTAPTSLPIGVGGSNRLAEFSDLFCDGFRRQSEQLLTDRENWTRAGGVLDSFIGLPRRIVLRNTRVYFMLRERLFDPAALRSSIAQGLKLEPLARAFLLSEICPKNWPVFEAEVRQLEQLDIPYFEHSIEDEDLPLPFGMDSIRGFMAKSSLTACRHRFKTLDQEEIGMQVQIIRGLVAARFPAGISRSSEVAFSAPVSAVALNAQSRRSEARRLADDLLKSGFHGPEGAIEWLGIDLGIDGQSLCFGIVGEPIFGGASGIAVFLAALGPDYLAAARGAMALMLEKAENSRAGTDMRWWRDQPLGLAGSGGILLGLQILAGLDPERAQRYKQVADKLLASLTPEMIAADFALDITAGVAGLIGPLLRHGSEKSIALAEVAGVHLMKAQGANGAWSAPMAQGRSVAGFSHGASGIAAAMGRLHTVTGKEQFAATARRALDFERSILDRQAGNWPDLRPGVNAGEFMNSWCNGAPGIALARLCLRNTALGDADLEDDLAIALRTTSIIDPAHDDLCCGQLGRSSILRMAGWHDVADRIEERVVATAGANQGRYKLSRSHQKNVAQPGLFKGTAGAGLALLNSPHMATLLSAGLLDPSVE